MMEYGLQSGKAADYDGTDPGSLPNQSVSIASSPSPSSLIVVRSAHHLGAPGSLLLWGAVGAAALLLALVFTLGWGMWPVLVFALLELFGLALCLLALRRMSRYREVIRIEGDRVRLERGYGRPEIVVEFTRYWTRTVRTALPGGGGERTRLWLTEKQRGCEIGACLSEEERGALARRLTVLLGPTVYAPDRRWPD
jgi:uncharacterized membrane protein